jgi:hypothetical protein
VVAQAKYTAAEQYSLMLQILPAYSFGRFERFTVCNLGMIFGMLYVVVFPVVEFAMCLLKYC